MTSPVKDEPSALKPSGLEPIKRGAASDVVLAAKPAEAAADGVGETGLKTPAAELTKTVAAASDATPAAAPDATPAAAATVAVGDGETGGAMPAGTGGSGRARAPPSPPIPGVPFPSTLTLGRWSVRRSLARAASSRRRCA